MCQNAKTITLEGIKEGLRGGENEEDGEKNKEEENMSRVRT